MASVQAQLRYINPEWRDRDEAPRIGDRESRHANTSLFDVDVHDAREAADAGLETSGFDLVEGPPMRCGTDRGAIRRDHEPHMARLVQEYTGASAAYVWFHLVRTEDQSDFNTAYSRFVHCDFNRRALRRMTTDLLRRHDLEMSDSSSYAWINTWQPFDHDVEQNPLATLDVRSLQDGDLIDYRYTGYDDEGGLVAAPVFNPAHRWYSYLDMATTEVLITKQLDSRPDHVQQTPHTSFDLADAAPDAARRRSIEMRLLAVFD